MAMRWLGGWIALCALSGCAASVSWKSVSRYRHFSEKGSEFFSPGQISESSQELVAGEGRRWRPWHPPENMVPAFLKKSPREWSEGELRAALEFSIAAAWDREKVEQRENALSYYLRAIVFFEQWIAQNGNISSLDHNLREAYNFSCARIVLLLKEMGWSGYESLAVPDRSNGLGEEYRIVLDHWKDQQLGYADFDYFYDPHFWRVRGFDRRYVESGWGGMLVGRRQWSAVRFAEDPFMLDEGTALPVNVTIRYDTQRRVAKISLHDLLLNDRAPLWSEDVSLAGDYSAPLALLLNERREVTASFFGVFKPHNYEDDMSLYMLEPFRSNKIPVIFVHGLNSQPAVWRDMVNELMGQREIRQNFQFLFFYYPTGFPISYIAADLRREIVRLQETYNSEKELPALNQIVLVGHSMGGILSGLQTRHTDPQIWRELFTLPYEKIDVTPEIREMLDELILFEGAPGIGRVVFICTPHRGSHIASSFIGRTIGRIIRFPLDLLQGRQLVTQWLTPQGHYLLENPPNSVEALQEHSPVLQLIMRLPRVENILYHSIMGDRGRGDTPESSDGIVPYSSSHVDFTASERIVPTHHGATDHPETIEEVKRLLLEHLESVRAVD